MNLFKKMTLMALLTTAVTVFFPAETSAQFDPCITNPAGECVDPNPNPNPNPGSGQAVWVGTWYDQFLVLHSVSASTFSECNRLLLNATAGQTVILGRCQRAN